LSKNLFCGCDTAVNTFTTWLLLDDGTEPVKSFSLDNNQVGAQALVDKLISLAKEHCVTNILIGTEATSMYDWHLLEFLSESVISRQFNLKLYRFNAKWIKNFKKSLAPRGKTDPVDSFAIAERLRVGRLPREYTPDFQYQPLRRLTRFRYHLMQSMAREKNFFLSNLFLKASSYNEVKPFRSPFTATSLATIEEFFSVDELANTSVDDLLEFVKKQGKDHFADAKEVVAKLKRVSRESYRLRPELKPVVNLVLASCLNNIRCYKETIKRVDDVIKEQMKAFRTTLDSVPGLGPVYCAGLIAEIGDIRRFDSQGSLAQFAGLTWPRYQSGKFEAEESYLAKTGNEYLRYYLVEAADSVRRHNAIYSEFYQKKYAEATKHHHKRALVLTARKLVRLVYALLSRQELYQPEKCSLTEFSKIGSNF